MPAVSIVMGLSGNWIDKAHQRKPPKQLILDRIERLALPPPVVNGRMFAQKSRHGQKTLASEGKACVQRARSLAKELEKSCIQVIGTQELGPLSRK